MLRDGRIVGRLEGADVGEQRIMSLIAAAAVQEREELEERAHG